MHILDVGSGTGRNANYLASLGHTISGIEISGTEIHIAEERATLMRVDVDYSLGNIGNGLPFMDGTFDLVVDVMCSNCLSEKERAYYFFEL